MLSCGINFEAGEMLWIVLGHDAATTMVDDKGSTTAVDWTFFGGKFVARYPGFGCIFHGNGFLDRELYLTTVRFWCLHGCMPDEGANCMS